MNNSTWFVRASAAKLLVFFGAIPFGAGLLDMPMFRELPGLSGLIVASGMAVGVGSFLAWMRQVADLAHVHRDADVRFFRVMHGFVSLYLAAFVGMWALAMMGFATLFGSPTVFFAVIFPLHIVAMIGSLYCAVFVSWCIARLETEPGASTFGATVLNVLLLSFWFPGLFILQPKVNRFAPAY